MNLKKLMPSKGDADIVIAGAGVAFADTVTGYVKPILPANIQAYAKLLVGWVGYKLGSDVSPMIGTFMSGVLMSAVSDLVSGYAGNAVKTPTGSPQISQSPVSWSKVYYERL